MRIHRSYAEFSYPKTTRSRELPTWRRSHSRGKSGARSRAAWPDRSDFLSTASRPGASSHRYDQQMQYWWFYEIDSRSLPMRLVPPGSGLADRRNLDRIEL